jgi:general secretion pathway protein M
MKDKKEDSLRKKAKSNLDPKGWEALLEGVPRVDEESTQAPSVPESHEQSPPSKQHILKVTDEEGRSIEQVTFDDRKPDTEIREQQAVLPRQAPREESSVQPMETSGRLTSEDHISDVPEKETPAAPSQKVSEALPQSEKIAEKEDADLAVSDRPERVDDSAAEKKPSRIATWVSDQHQIQRLVHLYRGLNIREQRIIAIGIVFFSCLFLYTFILDPLFEKNKLLKYQIEKKNQELSEMIHLRSSVVQDQDGMDRIKSVIDQRGQGFSVFAYLEQLATRAEMKDKIMYIKPQRETPVGPFRESLAEIRLDNINLEELTRFLYEIEASEDLLYIKNLKMKTSKSAKDQGSLEVTLSVGTLLRKR